MVYVIQTLDHSMLLEEGLSVSLTQAAVVLEKQRPEIPGIISAEK